MKKATILYYIAAILSIFKILSINSLIINLPNGIDKIIDIVIFSCFFLKLLFQKYKSLKELLLIVAIIFLCLLSSFICDDTRILISCLAIVCIKNVNIKKILCIDMCEKLIIIFFHIIIFFLDIQQGIITFATRNNFYFSHPNTIAALVLWCGIDYIYISSNNKKKNYLIYILIFLLQIFIYIFTKSRTPILTFTLLLILINKKNKKLESLIQKTSKYIFTILSIFIILFFSFYNQILSAFYNTISQLDILLSGRIYYSWLAVYNYGWTLFPKYVNYISSINGRNIIVDNIYIRFGVSYGIIFLILISYVTFKINKKNSNLENILLILTALVGLSEKYILNVFFCFPFLILGNNLFNKEVNKD